MAFVVFIVLIEFVVLKGFTPGQMILEAHRFTCTRRCHVDRSRNEPAAFASISLKRES
jgi:hypothetical protein